jgi:hypothetical protein
MQYISVDQPPIPVISVSSSTTASSPWSARPVWVKSRARNATATFRR